MDFQSEKSFGKLRLRAFQPYHSMYVEACRRYVMFGERFVHCLKSHEPMSLFLTVGRHD